MFCAKNNLALRGSSDVIGAPQSGIFLNTVELISHYNNTVANHIKHIKDGKAKGSVVKVSYLSPETQNQVIEILRSKVKKEIISKIKQAKYYSIMFDATPDTSHKEQITQIIRYVKIADGNCEIEESFIDFIETEEKTGVGLAAEIMKKLEQDGLPLTECRGQCYDNGANMAGVYKGVQAQILKMNGHARFVPCAAHTLNLVGVHAASVSTMMVTFFGTVQAIFNFFSASTSRWQQLMTVANISLKSHSDTRWTSRAAAVNSLHEQLVDVHSVLQKMSTDVSVNSDTASGAKRLLKAIDFKFICLLCMWSRILTLIDRINKSLQAKHLSLLDASKMVKGLAETINNLRDSETKDVISNATDVAKKLDVKPVFSAKRKRKVKRMADELTEDENHTLSDEQLLDKDCKCVFDSIISHLSWRYKNLHEVATDFSFLDVDFLMSQSLETLQKHAKDLASKYQGDLCAAELTSEVESFKFQAAELFKEPHNRSPLELLKFIHSYSLADVYPNIEIALRLYLTLPVTVASCERSFSKLKLVKNYLRSSMGQERLSGLAIMSIEFGIADSLQYDDVIDGFAASKSRKVHIV